MQSRHREWEELSLRLGESSGQDCITDATATLKIDSGRSVLCSIISLMLFKRGDLFELLKIVIENLKKYSFVTLKYIVTRLKLKNKLHNGVSSEFALFDQ